MEGKVLLLKENTKYCDITQNSLSFFIVKNFKGHVAVFFSVTFKVPVTIFFLICHEHFLVTRALYWKMSRPTIKYHVQIVWKLQGQYLVTWLVCLLFPRLVFIGQYFSLYLDFTRNKHSPRQTKNFRWVLPSPGHRK